MKLAVLYAGQGAQHPGMLEHLHVSCFRFLWRISHNPLLVKETTTLYARAAP